MTEEQRCKQTALDRLEDALALYEKERYAATLYMCGYVIELGIKYEFHKLANTKINDVKHKSGSIINQLFKSYDKQLPWIEDFSFPTTILEFTKFIDNLSTILDKSINANKLLKSPKNLNQFCLILLNRQQPTNDEVSSTFHNIAEFLKSLNEWKIAIGDPGFPIEDYKIDAKLGWGTHIRYGENSGANDIKDEEKNAKDALEMAMKFLGEVVSINIIEYESRLNESNKLIHDNIEKEY